MTDDLQNNLEYILNFFSDSKEGLLILDNEQNISYYNDSAKIILDQICNLTSIKQRFSFDVCVLDENNILKYSPLYAAIESKEFFKAESTFQSGENHYKKIIIRSFNLDTIKIILLSDFSSEVENVEFRKQIFLIEERINQLEKDNKDYASLKERAESQAIRIGLIHRISTSIRDTLDIEEIIKTALSEISKSLGIYRGYYADYSDEKLIIKYDWQQDEFSSCSCTHINIDQDYSIKEALLSSSSQISSSFDEKSNDNKPRLVTTVSYRGNILGILAFYYKNQNRIWHTEEVSLVEATAAQLAAALNQASLFEQLDNQNTELEMAMSKLRVAQAQLIQSEKMASLGKLVAGVAHEINTPIGAINSNNSIIQKCTTKYREFVNNCPDLLKFFDILVDINGVNTEAIGRINSIVKSLKNFARLDEAELKQVDIHEGLRSTIKLLNHETKDKIIIEEDFGDLSMIQCYPNLLNQVFMNILMNAIQSINGKGSIKIKTLQASNAINISISDSGCGISDVNLNKIFDPGFTTKGVGVGTGLGLSICYQILEKHKGSIIVDSKIGVGTTFTLNIPLIMVK
ncbi:MAG: ATP-binding protein [Candidatus Gastranaerophilales bacterium]|nr:ATP-binding protein [Candidatus Gastranaerophilales bacterium]